VAAQRDESVDVCCVSQSSGHHKQDGDMKSQPEKSVGLRRLIVADILFKIEKREH
jgi:hypothetical protein